MTRSLAFGSLLIVLCAGCGDSGSSRKASATRAYWIALHSAPRAPTQMNQAQCITHLRSCAARIESLPTKDVDADAVEFGLACAGWLRNMARFSEYANADENALFVRSFVNGFTGNWEGAASDFSQSYSQRSQAQSNLNEQFDLLSHQEAAVCAKLTSRYGVEFTTIPSTAASSQTGEASTPQGKPSKSKPLQQLVGWIYDRFGVAGILVVAGAIIALVVWGNAVDQASRKGNTKP